MRTIWRDGPATVREVHAKLRRPGAYTTVMTVMGRLVEKRLLRRTPLPNGAYRYTAVVAEERFAALTTRRLIEALVSRFGEVVVTQFFDVLDDVDPAKLRKLREKLKGSRHGRA